MRRIIGVDPGLKRTGYGVIRYQNGKIKIEEGGVLTTNSSHPLAQRVAEIAIGLREILDEWKPDALAIEQVFSLGKNPKSAILMAHARGAILALAGERAMPVFHYKPTQIKKLLTGSGKANKEQMQLVIKTELGLARVPEPHDVADAFAIAICHAHDPMAGSNSQSFIAGESA